MTTLPSALPHTLERTVIIRATPDIVFRFFTDSPRWATWWGAGSSIEPKPGGRMLIRHANGIEASGNVVEVAPPSRFVFTYGYANNKSLPPGSSRVTILLGADPAGTRLTLTHELADLASRDEHVQGWRFQLSLFANAVADEVNAGAAGTADAWFESWAEPDAAARETTLRRIASPHVVMNDRFSCLDSLDEVLAHITAAQRFMPGVRMRRAGPARHCQGVALADWVATGPDGKERTKGTNVFVLGPSGLIESVTGVAAGA